MATESLQPIFEPSMTDPFFKTGRIHKGLSFDAYMEQWRKKNALPMKSLDPVARRTRFYSKYNLDRHLLVGEHWKMSSAFREAILGLRGPQTWMFLTDDWCVDSAYSLPLLREAAALREDVTFHILLKDDNLDILDQYLTNGSRSIPKFVAFDKEGIPLMIWGPQPDAIRNIRRDLMDGGAEGSVVSSTTVDWYADRGWLEVERELTELMLDSN